MKTIYLSDQAMSLLAQLSNSPYGFSTSGCEKCDGGFKVTLEDDLGEAIENIQITKNLDSAEETLMYIINQNKQFQN